MKALEDINRQELLPHLHAAVKATIARWRAERKIESLVDSDTRPELDGFIEGLAVTCDTEEAVDELSVDVVDQLVEMIAADVTDDEDENEEDEDDDELEDCAVCSGPVSESGDSWGNLCPGCADKVSEYMDANNIDGEAARDQAIEAVRNGWTPVSDANTPVVTGQDSLAPYRQWVNDQTEA